MKYTSQEEGPRRDRPMPPEVVVYMKRVNVTVGLPKKDRPEGNVVPYDRRCPFYLIGLN